MSKNYQKNALTKIIYTQIIYILYIHYIMYKNNTIDFLDI